MVRGEGMGVERRVEEEGVGRFTISASVKYTIHNMSTLNKVRGVF